MSGGEIIKQPASPVHLVNIIIKHFHFDFHLQCDLTSNQQLNRCLTFTTKNLERAKINLLKVPHEQNLEAIQSRMMADFKSFEDEVILVTSWITKLSASCKDWIILLLVPIGNAIKAEESLFNRFDGRLHLRMHTHIIRCQNCQKFHHGYRLRKDGILMSCGKHHPSRDCSVGWVEKSGFFQINF